MITLRLYRPDDLPAVLQLFYDTVHTVNAADYSPAQLDAWADGHPDAGAWNASLLAHHTLVAEADGHIVGFADMDDTGYLDRLYVHKDWQRRGAAAALCGALEAAVPGPWRTHASLTALAFFAARGYRIVRRQQVTRHGVALTNVVMEKPAAGD